MQLDPEQFTAHLILQGLADNTARNYGYLYVRWTDWALAHGRNPHAPDPLAVRAWANQLPGGASILGQARAMMGHLCRLLDVDDMTGAIPLPRKPRVAQSRALTDLQVRMLIRQAERSGAAGTAVLVGLLTGARRSEIASLHWDRIDLDNRHITLVRTKVRDEHRVVLCDYLHRHLSLRQTPGATWLFAGRYGGHASPATVWQMVRDVADRAGIGKVTPHQLRHTIIGAVYDVGKDPFAAQRLAGHTDPAMTARYSHRSDRQILEAMEAALQKWLQESTEGGEAA